MKTIKLFAVLVMGMAMVACTPKNATPAVDGEGAAKVMSSKDLQPTKAQIDSVSYLLGVQLGSFMKSYSFGEDFNYNEIIRAIKDFVGAKGDFRSPEFLEQFKINPEEMNGVFNRFLEQRRQITALENKEAGDKFLADNAKKDGVQSTPSGLQYKIINAGNDVKPAATDTVWVNYKGTLLDGTVFDETPEGSDPVQLQLNRVIPGWTEGLQLIGEGGKIELYIPADLAYGENGTRGIDPNSTLVFDIDLSKVGKVAAE